jgi:hypothetical protein
MGRFWLVLLAINAVHYLLFTCHAERSAAESKHLYRTFERLG